MLSTLRTIFGFMGQTVQKLTPFRFSGDRPEDTFNYLQTSERLATSGQPTERQFMAIVMAGYTTVINLVPNSKRENAVIKEVEVLAAAGVNYLHLPVDFDNPTGQNYECFVENMSVNLEAQLWVHCSANVSVSAFIYRYRTSELGEEEAVARSGMTKIWHPYGVWRKFIGWD